MGRDNAHDGESDWAMRVVVRDTPLTQGTPGP